MEQDYGLVYIKHLGEDVNRVNTYQLFFCETPDDVWAEDWSVQPIANTTDSKPNNEYLHEMRMLCTERVLIPAQMNTCFSYQDCKDKIYAILYEDITDYDEYPEERLVFHYGDTLREVTEKLNRVGLEFEQLSTCG